MIDSTGNLHIIVLNRYLHFICQSVTDFAVAYGGGFKMYLLPISVAHFIRIVGN